jgi:transforming growth factor-beta-induced protein
MPTMLTNITYSNVVGGQQVMVTKDNEGRVTFVSGSASRATVMDDQHGDIKFEGGSIQIVNSVMHLPTKLRVTALDGYGKQMISFLGALYTTNLVEEFAQTPNMTLFIPRNSAFQQVAGTLSRMSTSDLVKVLRHHMIPGQMIHSWEITNTTKFRASSHGDVSVSTFANTLFVNSAKILEADILIANGVAHLVDMVLNPFSSAASPKNFTMKKQTPDYSLVSPTVTGLKVPTPFISALPCSVGCTSAVTRKTRQTEDYRYPTRTPNAGPAPALCTGIMGGQLGLGAMVGGAVGLGLLA